VLLLIVWIAVVVVALVVLGSVAYSLLGALKRLGGEVAALQRELRPVLAEAQTALERANRTAERRTGAASDAASDAA
jgi:Sec-independent protein translocase protein TatA